jgi:glucose/arabinose dehydrogenase
VTERSGTLRLLTSERLSEPVDGVPKVWARGQGGLLDVAAAPDFERSGLIFLSFSQPGNGGAGTAVARARLVKEGSKARLEDVEVIFAMEKKTSRGQHFGSRLVMRPDGTLFVTTGDRGDGKRAQDMNDSAGAVLRINTDGSAPGDNPYANGGALPQLWSKGHRNVQGAAFDPVTDSLITVEHGAKGGDEINRPEAGRTMAGRSFPMASTTTAARSARARRRKAWSSRFSTGTRRSRHQGWPSMTATCFRNGRAICWSAR